MLEERTERESSQDQDPLRRAFEEHYEPLLRLCTLLTGHRQEAEEIVQESFLRSAGRLASLRPDARGSYLRRVAINLWKNRLRRLALELRVLREHPGVEDATNSPESHDELWQAVLALPARQRACIALRYYEDLSERETADTLGCSVGTVKSQTSRALARLRKGMQDGP